LTTSWKDTLPGGFLCANKKSPIEHSADGIDELFRVSWSEPGFANFSVAAIEQSMQNKLTAMKARVQFG
jgi:hypothetical protein